ncbi:MAG: hypothetical protein KC931_22285, partial [Candidatus Omnitrophica bacterium]|nr:hypothetical protein [Candidatus Omnitrophota bacterium]
DGQSASVLKITANHLGAPTEPSIELDTFALRFDKGEAVPAKSIVLELTWDTPNDPDQTDTGPEAGSDIDLHFAHPNADAGVDLDHDGAPDPWFDIKWDTFWFNGNPNWGDSDPSTKDNPNLDRDDVDGAGPEIISLNSPEIDSKYRVGVHYWNDHGYGASTAKLRVFIDGDLVYSETAELTNHDMWDVATIDWPSGAVTPVRLEGDAQKITPDYQNPSFFQPGKRDLKSDQSISRNATKQIPLPGIGNAELNAVIANLYIYLDDGSGAFEAGADSLVTTLDNFSLSSKGIQLVPLPDGDPNVQLSPSQSKTYFVVLEAANDASGQLLGRFRVTHLTDSSDTVVSQASTLPDGSPLVLESMPDVSTLVAIGEGAPIQCPQPYPDFDRDGDVDGNDGVLFLDAFKIGGASAELTEDGMFDGLDLFEFESHWHRPDCTAEN